MANSALAFGALLGGAVVLEYGIRHSKAAFSSSSSSSAGSASTTGGGGTTVNIDPSTAQGSDIDQIWSVLQAAGLNATAAAGVIGNGYQESSFNTASTGDGGGGWWGFSTSGGYWGGGPGTLQAYAQAKGVPWTNPTLQAEYLVTKLSASDIQTLNQQGSPESAAEWFMNNWEHPYAATENLARRQQGAQIAYQQITQGGGNG